MYKIKVLSVLLVLSFNSCSVNKKSTNQDEVVTYVDSAHNSRNSLDWDGTYRGIFPCDDCPGIRMEIILFTDLKYILSKQHMDGIDSVYSEKGTFSWNEAGSQILLNSAKEDGEQIQFFIGENTMIMLDKSGEKFSQDLSGKFTLLKTGMDNRITDKYWKLVELGGSEIINTNENLAHVILRDTANRVTGHTGCNSFTGSYELGSDNLLSFSPLASTRMYCQDVNHEDNYLVMFDRARSYTLKDDSLHLYDEYRNLLGVFIWDFFKNHL